MAKAPATDAWGPGLHPWNPGMVEGESRLSRVGHWDTRAPYKLTWFVMQAMTLTNHTSQSSK